LFSPGVRDLERTGARLFLCLLFNNGSCLQSFGLIHFLSDAAPHTSGSALVDSQASLKLAERALQLALLYLKPGGAMVVKVFQGGEENLLLERMRAAFRRARAFKPGASRSESREVYFLGFEKKACGAGPEALS
jgi:23S rRNA U2552 (ribose-2'-O)-methylase RlmE/FtsJ